MTFSRSSSLPLDEASLRLTDESSAGKFANALTRLPQLMHWRELTLLSMEIG